MPIKPFELMKVPLPKLKFANNNIEVIASEGLRKFGPYDMNERKINTLNLLVVAPTFAEEEVRGFANILKELAGQFLKINLNIVDTKLIDDKLIRSIDDYLSIVYASLDDHPETHVILQVLARKITRKDENHYVELRKHAFKIGKVAVQSVTLPNLIGKDVKLKAGNVLLGIYAKAGGKPWQLSEPISSFFSNIIYLGYDIARTGENRKIGIALVYDNKGQLMYSKPYVVSLSGDVIKSSEMKSFVYSTLSEISKKVPHIDVVIIHKNGDVSEEEASGITAAIKEINKDIKVVIVSFPKAGVVPLLAKQNENYGMAPSGYFFYTGQKNNQPTFLLQTFGLDMVLVPDFSTEELTKISFSARVVNLLQFSVKRLSDNLKHELTPENVKSFYHDLTRQIFYLSRLNWGSSIGKARNPVTTHYAQKVSKLLASGLSPEELVWDKLWMI